MTQVLILGAASDIGRALAHEYARAGSNLYLTARKAERLEADCSDLALRYGIQVRAIEFDALDFASHSTLYSSLDPAPTGVIYVAGYLGDNEKAQSDFSEARRIIDTNYSAAVSLLNLAAASMAIKRTGFIIGISSVAGERGRGSNYYYGSAKAGLSAYLSGLRNRLAASGVTVLTVKPGFVATKMTEGMPLPPLLTARAEQVAGAVFRAQQKGRNEIFSLWYWRPIMAIIRSIPEFIFKKLSL